MDAGQIEARKVRARGWFESLRDEICAAFGHSSRCIRERYDVDGLLS